MATIGLAREAGSAVMDAIADIVGTPEAREDVGMGADGTMTERIDLIAEDAALEVLGASGVPMVVLSEEKGRVNIGGEPELVCVMDPVDGSYNATHGIPEFCFSLAFSQFFDNPRLDSVSSALVMNLATGATFTATRGGGAFLDGKRIETDKAESLSGGALGVYVKGRNISSMAGLLPRPKQIRTMGAVALEMCYVAHGGLRALVDVRGVLRVTDMAAGKLIIEEAGGVVECPGNDNPSLVEFEGLKLVAAGCPSVFDEIMGEIGT